MEQDFIRPGAYNLLGSGSGSLGNGMNKSINPPGRGRALSGSVCKSQGELGFSSAGSGSGPSRERFGIPGSARDQKPTPRMGNDPGISPGTVRVLLPTAGSQGVLSPRLHRPQTSGGNRGRARLLLQSRFLERLGFIPDPSRDHRLVSVLSHCKARS